MTALIKSQIDTAAALAFGVIRGEQITAWEKQFLDDMLKRYERYGDKTAVSEKQAAIIGRIAAKAH